MSVINKMLKDLDERQDSASPQGQSSQVDQSSAKSFANQTTTTGRSINAGLLGILVVIAGLLGFIGWQMMQSNSSQSRDNGISLNSADVSGSSTQSPLSSENESVISSNIGNENNNELGEDGLPVPEADPDPAAELPAEVAPEEELVREVALVEEETLPNPIEELEQSAVEVEAPTTVDPTTTSSSAAVTPKAVEGNSPAPTFVIEKTSNKLTPEERVERLLDKAKTAYEKGYITEAIEDLTKLLAISDSNIEARTLLAGAWYGRGEGNRAIAIINDGLQRYPLVEEWRTTAAKIFFKENNLAGAFSYLNVELAGAGKEFYTLKGNLARQLKEFGSAESAYQKLTELEPFVGNWWLGLAIAQDSQAKAEQALQSYQRVIATGGVSAQSVAFAQQRIEVLKG